MDHRKPVIICVDDEINVLRSLRAEIQEAMGNDYLIEIAEEGEEALELVEELLEDELEIPLIISDQIMPKMKGDELLKCVQELSPKTLKILLTGQADLEAVARAIKYAKLYRYIAKPWDPQDLSLTVTEALNSYFQTKQLSEQNLQCRLLNEELAKSVQLLAASERKFRAIFNQTFQFTGMLDIEGILVETNQTALDFGGLQLEDVVGKPFWQCRWWASSEETQVVLQAAIADAVKGKFIRYEVDVLGAGNITATIDFSIKPIIDENGKLEHLIVEGRDVSDRKKAEIERRKFTEELFILNEAFSRFVPKQFLQSLARKSIKDIDIGESVKKNMSVLFADIRGFTSRSERMPPESIFKFINGYLQQMEPAIIENGGFIDKFIGDEIMALFESNADSAVNAGVKMLQILAEYNLHRNQCDRQPVEIGIGINTGELVLGTVGGKSRMDTTVIGDTVNLGSRLQQLTKTYNTPLLISHHTLSRLDEPIKYALRWIARVQVRGKEEQVSVFEVFEADTPEQKQAKLETKPIFESALLNYYQENIEEAISVFENCIKINPGDRTARAYLEKCRSRVDKKDYM